MTLHDNNGDDNNNNEPLSGQSSDVTLPMSGAPSSLPGRGNLPLGAGPVCGPQLSLPCSQLPAMCVSCLGLL